MYKIIEASSPEALVIAVQDYITANAGYYAIGNPIFVSVSLFAQAVYKPL